MIHTCTTYKIRMRCTNRGLGNTAESLTWAANVLYSPYFNVIRYIQHYFVHSICKYRSRQQSPKPCLGYRNALFTLYCRSTTPYTTHCTSFCIICSRRLNRGECGRPTLAASVLVTPLYYCICVCRQNCFPYIFCLKVNPKNQYLLSFLCMSYTNE